MSFILDALRKSDQQRQRSAAPPLLSAQVPAVESRQPALWWYGLLAAVLMGAGILIGWMHQWQAEPAVPAIQPDAGRSRESGTDKFVSASPPTLPAVPVLLRQPENQQPTRKASAVTQSAPSPSAAETLAPMPATGLPGLHAAASGPSEAPAPVEEERTHTGLGDAARESAVMALPELPSVLLQEIPKLAVLIHSYSSKPKSRFVFINDRKWREEEYPAPGLRLEQITPDGMIFSYKGYRFRRGINP